MNGQKKKKRWNCEWEKQKRKNLQFGMIFNLSLSLSLSFFLYLFYFIYQISFYMSLMSVSLKLLYAYSLICSFCSWLRLVYTLCMHTHTCQSKFWNNRSASSTSTVHTYTKSTGKSIAHNHHHRRLSFASFD